MSRLDEFRRKKSINLWPVTLLRVYTGVFFLYYGFGKIRDPRFADALAEFVTSQLEHSVAFVRPYLESVVLPHKGLFAIIVSWGELAIGIALILGLATRWASIAGALFVASIWSVKGQGVLDAQNQEVVWLMIFIVLAAVHAGRAHGLDERLARRFRLLS